MCLVLMFIEYSVLVQARTCYILPFGIAEEHGDLALDEYFTE